MNPSSRATSDDYERKNWTVERVGGGRGGRGGLRFLNFGVFGAVLGHASGGNEKKK